MPAAALSTATRKANGRSNGRSAAAAAAAAPQRKASGEVGRDAKRQRSDGGVAALGSTESKGGDSGEIPLGRLLASTEKKTRDSAIRSLARFLASSGHEPLPAIEMAKLWKGIFYCFWMSDKALVQQALAQELSDLVLAVPETSRGAGPSAGEASGDTLTARARGGLALLEGFWDAMTREWSGLDKWRIDKFYMLLRRFVNAAFRLLASEGWEPAAVDLFASLLTKTGGPLCANDVKVPSSLTYHLTDVYLEELDKALMWAEKTNPSSGEGSSSNTSSSSTEPPLLELIRPMIQTAATCHSKTVYDKVLSNVLQPLADDCLRAPKPEASSSRSKKRSSLAEDMQDEDEDDEDDNGVMYPSIMRAAPPNLRLKLYRLVFTQASQDEALPSRRRALYALCKDERERRGDAGESESESEDEE